MRCICCGEAIWHLLATSVKKQDVLYDLEPNVKYAQIEFVLHLDRKPLYFIVNIVLPCCLLVVISLLVSLSFTTALLSTFVISHDFDSLLTLYRMVMPIGTPFLKEKINN